MSSKIPINEQAKIADAIKAALSAGIELPCTLGIEAPRAAVAPVPVGQIPFYYKGREHKTIANDPRNIRMALHRLGVRLWKNERNIYYSSVEGKTEILGLAFPWVRIRIMMRFGFRPPKVLLMKIMTELAREGFPS